MKFSKNKVYFLDEYSNLNSKDDKDLLYKKILENIRTYNELIFDVLQKEDIYDHSVQLKIIDYQKKKIDVIFSYNTIRRREEIVWYFKYISNAKNKQDINFLKRQLDQQKINAKEDSLFFTDQEKELILEKMKKRLRYFEIIQQNNSKKSVNSFTHQL